MLQKNKYENFPGWEVVGRGLRDISQGRENSIFALAVLISSKPLNELGFSINSNHDNPNIFLYQELCKKYNNEAHYQYNAIMQRIVKFCNSVENNEIKTKMLN